MALQSLRSKRLVQLLGVALALAMVAVAGFALVPPARAAYTGNGVTLAAGKYTGTNIYVPGEVMQITLTATPGDVINILIEDASATYTSSISNLTIGTSGERIVTFTIPTSWPDGFVYSVRATDTTSAQLRVRNFGIETYNVGLWTDRYAYLPGDGVTVSWSVTYITNGSAAPAGTGVIEAYDSAGLSLLTIPQFNFTSSQGTYFFTIPGTEATGQNGFAYLWFNDTAGLREYQNAAGFAINPLGIIETLSAGTYAPGGVVIVSIYTRVSPNPANPHTYDPAAPGIPVSVNVTDLTTGNVVPAYSMTGLVTDASGFLNYVFQLGTTPTTGSYEVDATATAHGTMSASTSATFDVQATASLSAQITLDKLQYASGDTIHASAQVFSTAGATVTYTWEVIDVATGITFAFTPGATSTYTYAIPQTYTGALDVVVLANDGNGTTASAVAIARVSLGFLALSLDKSQFNPGDTITASFSLQSNVITNPTYFWQVVDASGVTASAGSTTGGSATYTTPNPASNRYTFVVTASQQGRTVQASQTATQANGYFLTVVPDRSSYNAGDTITLQYTVTARGTAALPSIYHFVVYILGMPVKTVDTTSASGTFTYPVPAGAPQGDQLLYVADSSTGAYTYVVVHVGPVNPLLTDVAGVPLFDILIFLLFIVLLLAVILLWRRTGMGRAPPSMEAGKPSTPPPPPPSGPSQQSAGPMSVACKHCGANIEITTSKRPIEVMCPSCGETQVVQ
jgi:hypothetical protein